MIRRSNFAWTRQEDERLTELAGRGVVLARLAIALQRSEASVKRRARHLKITIRRQSRLPYADRAAFLTPKNAAPTYIPQREVE